MILKFLSCLKGVCGFLAAVAILAACVPMGFFMFIQNLIEKRSNKQTEKDVRAHRARHIK